jgi:hypothetical protein
VTGSDLAIWFDYLVLPLSLHDKIEKEKNIKITGFDPLKIIISFLLMFCIQENSFLGKI